MKLTERQIQRFYRIWWNLLNYVNEKRQLSSVFPVTQQTKSVHAEQVLPLREALWADDSLRESFILENPAQLATTDLELLKSWEHRVSDNFFINRYLKHYAVFIDSHNKGYAVYGISDAIETMTGGVAPIYVQTVLLPFEDCIIYDSILSPYPLRFGSGYKQSIQDAYRAIQERGGLISQLPPASPPSPELVRAGNAKVLTAFRRELAKSGLSPKKIEEHSEHIAEFSESFLLRQSPAVFLLDMTVFLLDAYRLQYSGSINWVSFKRFVRFLTETGRTSWDQAEILTTMIKKHS